MSDEQTAGEPDPYWLAREIAEHTWLAHFRTQAPEWLAEPTTTGVLHQISAMLTSMTAQQTAGEPVAWEAKYKAAREVIGELCDGKRRWTMSVPARPDHDPDLVICDALDTMRRALLRTTEDTRNNVAAVKWIAQQFCDEFGNPKGDMPQWAYDITDILILGLTPVAHPRPRVGVTEAAKIIETHLAYTNGWRVSDERYTEHCTQAAMEILSLADSPAPLANGGGEVADGR